MSRRLQFISPWLCSAKEMDTVRVYALRNLVQVVRAMGLASRYVGLSVINDNLSCSDLLLDRDL